MEKIIDWKKEGYVCEEHPTEVFMHDGCTAPGMQEGSVTRLCSHCGLPKIPDTSFCQGELNEM